jgi:cell wall-associated NlpC family hydrolase
MTFRLVSRWLLLPLLGVVACKGPQPLVNSALPVEEVERPPQYVQVKPPKARKTKPKRTRKPEPPAQVAQGRKSPAPTPTPAPVAPKLNKEREAQIQRVLAEARSYLNTPYQWGGMSRKGIDCSGLTSIAYQAIGRSLPRVAGDQAAVGKYVSIPQLQPGDLLFFHSGKPGYIQHTGIVFEIALPSILFIHASSAGVRFDDLNSDYWRKHFVTARRYLY